MHPVNGTDESRKYSRQKSKCSREWDHKDMVKFLWGQKLWAKIIAFWDNVNGEWLDLMGNQWAHKKNVSHFWDVRFEIWSEAVTTFVRLVLRLVNLAHNFCEPKMSKNASKLKSTGFLYYFNIQTLKALKTLRLF